MDQRSWAPGERRVAGVVATTVLGSVLWPLRQYLRAPADRRDGFPLSYYPMFSGRRRTHCGITYVVAVGRDGDRRFLHHSVLGPAGINQVRRQLFRVAVREGCAEPYARALADRVARRPDCADVRRIEVVRGRFDLDTCLLTHEVRSRETVLAAAAVPVPAPDVPA